MVAAGLLIRSFARVISVDPGFQPANALTASIRLPRARYTKPQQIAAFETQVVEKMSESEEVDTELETRADEINSHDAKRNEALSAFDAEVKAARKELAIESAKRDEVFKTLPANLASVYNRLAQRSRDGIAVAEVVNGSCSACFMSLRPQMSLEVKRGDKIITCESCTRILYIASEKPQAEEATAS